MNLVELHIEGKRAIVTLHNPPVNALNQALRKELKETMSRLAVRSDVLAIVIAGAGEKAFCAGADLKEEAISSVEDALEFRRDYDAMLRTVEHAPQPVIAAIHGYALGGGFELALCCDLRIAASNSVLGTAAIKLGRLAVSQRLPRLIGESRAKELIYTGRRITGQQAEAYGLVTQAVPREDLMNVALSLADEIAQNGPLSLKAAKRAIAEGRHLPEAEAQELENRYWLDLVMSQDAAEAVEAFFARRPPTFRGV